MSDMLCSIAGLNLFLKKISNSLEKGESTNCDQVAKYLNLTPLQLEILAYLTFHRETISPDDLARKLRMSYTVLQINLRRLQTRRLLVTREDDVVDVADDALECLLKSIRNNAENAFDDYFIDNSQAATLEMPRSAGPVSCPVNDIVDELRKISINMTQVNRLYDNIESGDNKRLKDCIDKLEIKSQSERAQIAFWKLAKHFIEHFTAPLAFIQSSLASGEGPDVEDPELKDGCAELVKLGYANSLPIESMEDTHETDRYVITPKVTGVLFHGREDLIKYDELSHFANVILAKDIVKKELYFTKESQEEVDNLKRILSQEGFNRAKAILKRQRRNPAVQSLFFGPPGTGKTEVIKQIARETGRDLIMFDVAKVTASAWGATEKNYRSLLLAYDYIASISNNVGILVLNEADNVLGRRLSSIDRAIDKAENTVSNILLQAFEDMSGILLATTNLASNMDEAFDRRFLFKTQLSRPDATARKKIWASLVPDLSDADATTLAEKYDMSGGQISNVVAKRDLAELYYVGDRGLAYISNLCKLELQGPIKGTGARRVGF